jgi:hypothetical protein
MNAILHPHLDAYLVYHFELDNRVHICCMLIDLQLHVSINQYRSIRTHQRAVDERKDKAMATNIHHIKEYEEC